MAIENSIIANQTKKLTGAHECNLRGNECTMKTVEVDLGRRRQLKMPIPAAELFFLFFFLFRKRIDQRSIFAMKSQTYDTLYALLFLFFFLQSPRRSPINREGVKDPKLRG